MNYIKHEFDSKRKEYEFIDFPEAYFKSCCEQNGVKARLEATMKLENSPYILIICTVPAEKSDAFEKAMLDLERKMLICGHNDYPNFCESYFEELEYLNNPKCPDCGSDNIAEIYYEYPKLPFFIKRRFKKRLENKKVILSDCKNRSDDDNNKWHCNECGCEF